MSDKATKKALYKELFLNDLAEYRFDCNKQAISYQAAKTRTLQYLVTNHPWAIAILGIDEEWEGTDHRCQSLVKLAPFLSALFAISTAMVAFLVFKDFMPTQLGAAAVITNLFGWLGSRNIPDSISSIISLKSAIKFSTKYNTLFEDANMLRFQLRTEWTEKTFKLDPTPQVTVLMEKKKQLDQEALREIPYNEEDVKSIESELKGFKEADLKQEQEFCGV